MINGWIVCLGDQSNPRGFFTSKADADNFASLNVLYVVFEARATSPFYYVNLVIAPF